MSEEQLDRICRRLSTASNGQYRSGVYPVCRLDSPKDAPVYDIFGLSDRKTYPTRRIASVRGDLVVSSGLASGYDCMFGVGARASRSTVRNTFNTMEVPGIIRFLETDDIPSLPDE